MIYIAPIKPSIKRGIFSGPEQISFSKMQKSFSKAVWPPFMETTYIETSYNDLNKWSLI